MIYKLKYFYIMFIGYIITYRNILLVEILKIFKNKKYNKLLNDLCSIISKSKSKL